MRYSKQIIEYLKKLGIRIKDKRKHKNISIKKMSDLTGIRVEYLKKIEEGTAYRVLIGKHLLKIANVLRVKLSDLFDFQ